MSIIIPNYNHAAFLQQRIESVLNQTYKNFEVIILDDASTDNSRSIIENYRGNVKVSAIIYNEVNSGSTFKQWKKGINAAKGQYIWIAESDDYCVETFLQKAVDQLEILKSDVHYCQSHLVNENNSVLEYTLKWPEAITSINWKQPFALNGKEFIKTALRYRNVIPNASAVVFRKSNFNFDGLSKYKSTGDWLFWVRLLLSADISFSPEILNRFRSHQNTTRGVTGHRKILLRYFEELAVRSDIDRKYHLGDVKEMQRFLHATIDVSRMSDVLFFAEFCHKFNLPNKFLLKFIMRKAITNRFAAIFKNRKSNNES